MSISLTIARAIVRAASWLVPSGRSAEWRAEWDGELSETGRRVRGRNAIVLSLGAIPHAVAELRQEWSFDVLAHETRNAMRAHLRNPAHSLTAALLIALGVGANTTVFTLVNAVLLRAPRGIDAPERVVQIGRVNMTNPAEPRGFDSWSYPLFADFRAQSKSFAGVAAHTTVNAVIGGDDDAQTANVQLVSANYFSLLGARVARGRAFVADDDAIGAPPVAIVSDALWRERFGVDEQIVGKTIRVRGTPFQIVGVAAPEFAGADVGAARPSLWTPIGTSIAVLRGDAGALESRRSSWLWVIGRLATGVDIGGAEAELRGLHRSIQIQHDGRARESVALSQLGLRPDDRAMAKTISTALFAMVALVLLVASANLAALLLARGAAREGEIGLRLAIGASRGRVVRYLLLETLIIAIVGSVAAFISTRWTARFIEWLMPYAMSTPIAPDARVLVFAIAVGVTTSVAFGVAPALRATRVDLLALLRASAVGATTDRGQLRTSLLVAQIALSFVLLGAAGLMTRSLQRANAIDPGFNTDGVMVADLDLRTGDTSSVQSRVRRLEEIAARAAATPGVLSAALASSVPASGRLSNRGMRPADAPPSTGIPPIVSTLVVDTGYFHAMGVGVVRGRQFDAAAERAGPLAVVVNETLARRFWPDADPIGKQVTWGAAQSPQTATVIGVARDTRNRSLRSPTDPQVYYLLAQNPSSSMLLHIRVSPGQEGVARTIAADARSLMPGAPPVQFQPIRARLAQSYADVRLISILGSVFGVLALALAAAGIYGVVSYETARRRREYGVRLALGARRSQVHAMVLTRIASLSGIGIVIGAIGFALVGPVLKQWLFGISPFDPVTLATITVVLLAAACLAALGPASRAARSDPIASLRAE